MTMKRIATIQDVSCLGKCSLTVALPVISAFGVETCIVPTAVLSTHTMFKNYTFRDLTSDLEPIKEHWKREGFSFDALYSGYLGSDEQLSIVKDYFTEFKTENNIILIDPVMADNGKLYPGFTPEFAKKMAKLCGVADIIVPNLTEASYMTGEKYVESGYSEEYIRNMLQKLVALGAKTAVLTGVSFDEGKIGVYGYDNVKGEYFSYFNERVPASYHGTGDIFSSAVLGGLMRGYSLLKSLRIAADFTAECIRVTLNDKNSVDYGVEFELVLPELIKEIEING